MSDSLVLFERGALLLAEADTVQKTKELKNLALTAADWAKRKGMGEDAIRHCMGYALDAERKMGEMLASESRGKGERKCNTTLHLDKPTLAELDVGRMESSRAQALASLPKEEFEAVKSGTKTRSKAMRDVKKKVIIRKLSEISRAAPQTVKGVFDVLVIDPPWPMEKIEREVRPNQAAFDYPTMTHAEIENLVIDGREIKDVAARSCHTFLWTTQRFLPNAFDILARWGARYVATFVWHKPGGFQPVGLPQYNCEFCVYGRIGSPIFTNTKAFNLCFTANRTAHSEKPEDFYATLRRTTAGRRLDVFNRRKIDGFIGYGYEAK